MSANSVFMKKKQDYSIDYSSILKTVPENSYIEPQSDKLDKVEMRWRFLCIPTSNLSKSNKNNNKDKFKKLVEISRMKNNSNREYLNKNMKWVEAVVDPIFDQFVVKQYFYYSDQ